MKTQESQYSELHADVRPNPEVSAAQVRRVTWIGLFINLSLAVLKFAAGVVGRSQVVVADSVHSLSDCLTDVAILVGVRFWSKPPDEKHPHGHRRIETVITVAIGVALAAVAVQLAYHALATLAEPHLQHPAWIAFAAAVVSIITKESLYRWTIVVGRRVKSSAVVANAWEHRSDAFSSIPAALAVAIAIIWPTWSFVDHVGAVVVSLFILQAAWKIVRPSLGQLVDAGASKKDCKQIEAIALTTEGVKLVHAIRTRFIGSGLQVDLHIKVNPDMSVREGHDISERVKQALVRRGPDVIDVVVHLEPYEEPR